MVPHMIAGASFENAAKAVLEDDKRIYEECQKEEIKRELSLTIYRACRA